QLQAPGRATRGPGFTPCRSGDLSVSRIRCDWRPDQLWTKPPGPLSPGRQLRRKNPQGREACRPAGSAADDIRARRQSQDCQQAWHYRAARYPRSRRRGHRVMNRRELLLLFGAMTAAHTLSAQQKAMPVIGYLNSASPGPAAPYMAAFRQGLGETGYVEEQ